MTASTIEGGQAAIVMATALNLLGGTSLSYLWQLVNSLQILTHIPLLNLKFTPMNSLNFHSQVASLINMDRFPSDELFELIFDFTQPEEQLTEDARRLSYIEDDGLVPLRFDLMGYSSTNIIENLGFFFWVLMISLFGIGLFFMIHAIIFRFIN